MSSEFDDAVAKNTGLEIELTTGRKVKLRLVELTRFLANGEIPDTLTPLVARELFPEEVKTSQQKIERYLESLKVAKWVSENVLVTPIKNLFDDEFFEIYDLANHPAKALHRFRLQQASNVGLRAGVREVETVTEPTP